MADDAKEEDAKDPDAPDDPVEVTDEDVADAAAYWRSRAPEGFAGLMDAEAG